MSDKYQDIVKKYAENRIELSNVKKQIDELLSDGEGNYVHIDISKYRNEFYENTDRYGSPPVWKGWTHCLEHCDEEDYTHGELVLARLLDKKKSIIREAGQIKRNICAIGRGLIKAGS